MNLVKYFPHSTVHLKNEQKKPHQQLPNESQGLTLVSYVIKQIFNHFQNIIYSRCSLYFCVSVTPANRFRSNHEICVEKD